MAINLDGNGLLTTGLINQATAQSTATNLAFYDFTGIPAGVKRLTVMFNQVSTSGSSYYIIQIGSGSVSTSGYRSTAGYSGPGAGGTGSETTTGFVLTVNGPASIFSGAATISNITGNTWVYTSMLARVNDYYAMFGAGNSPALSGAIDRVRITTVGGTETFDSGSINILYE